jgi:hypothetical protein
MGIDGDLYGEDILLWPEKQGALLRRLSSGEQVTGQVDWPNVVDEIKGAGRGRLPMPRPGEVDVEAITSTLLLHASDLLRAHFRDQWLAAMQMLAQKAKREVEMGWASEGHAGRSEIDDLRGRIEDAETKLAEAQHELAAAQEQAEAATARAVAAPGVEQPLRQADTERRAKSRLTRILAAWRRE